MFGRGNRDGFRTAEFNDRSGSLANTLILILDTNEDVFGSIPPTTP
jgi:hypothetical protein